MISNHSNRLAAIVDFSCRATPAGGPRYGGRGCIIVAFAMWAGGASADPIVVPSGQPITAIEYLSDSDETGTVLRARYLAAELTAQSDSEVVFADMAHLCANDALSLRDTMDDKPDRIIVSLSSEAIEFGAVDASVTQFFEAYDVETGRCIWELF